MTLDGFTLHYIVDEIGQQITGCKVDKVSQPKPDTVILSFRAPGKSVRLLVSASASDSRMHITNYKYENPKTPPAFCMFLRKHLTGAKVAEVKQNGLDRIVNISLECRDELGLPLILTMVIELMGKYSNIILIDENDIIMDSLRHVTLAQSRVRSVLPSLKYELPKSDKLNPLTVSQTTLVEMLKKKGSRDLRSYLSRLLQGVSSRTAEEILLRYMPSGYEQQPKEAEKLAEHILLFFKMPPCPLMYLRDDGMPFFYSPVEYKSVAAQELISFNDMNTLVDEFYKKLDDIRVVSIKRDTLKKRVSKHLEKLSHRLQKQLESIEKAEKADEYKNKADMITANIYRINKGMDSLVAEDFLTGEPVIIKMDKRLSPSANAQSYYKRYSKLKSGMDITLRRMLENKKEISFLESVLVSLDSSETKDELAEIEFELQKAGLMPQSRYFKTKATEKPSSPHRFLSSDGYTFYAGKNNRQNDTLTMKTAAAGDVWLHTKDIPGSHVLITGVKQEVPDNTLFEAATVAATLSRAKTSAKVAVDYTRRKNVRKPNGARPGMVVYDNYNTVLVNPDRELLKRLLVK